jgi:FdrA protein
MPTQHRGLPNLYRDSVMLMQLSSTLASMRGVSQAYAVMGTWPNLDLLKDGGVPIEGIQAKQAR